MAKLALINREEKRAKLAAKYAAKRAALVAQINDSDCPKDRMAARLKLQQLPRNASPFPAAQPLCLDWASAWCFP